MEREQLQSPQALKQQQIFEAVKPFVVQVYAVLRTQMPFGYGTQAAVDKDQHLLEQFHFLGSGFFFDNEGHIVTAAHLVLRPKNLEVDGSFCPTSHGPRGRPVKGDLVPFPLAIKDSFGRLHAAHLCGLDETTDVAVLRVEDSFQRSDLPHLHGKFADARPAMGDIVATYAATEHANEPIGATGQVLQPSQTFRRIQDSGSIGLLQLDLPTFPGMSGAPVVNMEGSIVGMLVKKFDMCGLALPSTVVLRVAESLRDSGEFTVPSIGLLVAEEVPRLAAARQNFPTASGLKVCGVTPGSSADGAGVCEGDRIIYMKGEAMNSIGRLREIVLLHKGGPIEITVQRCTVMEDSEVPRQDIFWIS
ncbi:hypothetical protein, conserved [Eimeria praecox]|uniref:PDZ domain-containing protein n=1 Tax=Eimeria praecox TaxID=51316 RepID=U6G898_9EIME|nr:hypothetical protein, conserved [Eimeria praecox]